MEENLSITFDPHSFVNKIAPPSKIKKMLKGNLSLKKTALTLVDGIQTADDISVKIDADAVAETALKVVSDYQIRVQAAAEDGDQDAADELATELADAPALLIQRVQNQLIFQVHDEIKTQYGGQRAIWLPSSADEPRPEHQLNYGKEYIIGEGIDGIEPGDDYGCQCGVEILTDDTEMDLGSN